MANTFQLSVVAPDKTIVDEVTESVTAPGVQGYFGVLAGHEPFVTQLKSGVVAYLDGAGQEQKVAVSGGFVEASGDHVIILADSAERGVDIDRARAESAASRAKDRLANRDGIDTPRAKSALERAENRLRLAK
ncbi:MAG: F0F1 ATP synthase subunit epsilon [Fimbriimonadales bacterium]